MDSDVERLVWERASEVYGHFLGSILSDALTGYNRSPGFDEMSRLHRSTVGQEALVILMEELVRRWPNDNNLVLVNPIGLEDWKAKGVPYRTVDQWFERAEVERGKLKAYEQKTYYDGRWKPEYDKWVDMLAGLNGPVHRLVAWNSALIYDMIFTQPIVYELANVQVPTLLMIGQADTTAIGSDIAPAEVKAEIGKYPGLGRAAQKAIPGADLIEFPGLGHAPQMEEPAKFNLALTAWMEK